MLETSQITAVATAATAAPDRPFLWRDGERLVRYGRGTVAELGALLDAEGLTPSVVLAGGHWGVGGTGAGARVDTQAGAVAGASGVGPVPIRVPPGPVPEVASAIAPELEGRLVARSVALVACGGGRVIDVAKALAAAYGLRVAAVPTTLSGAEMSGGHRPLADGRGSEPLHPCLVVNDPSLSASQPFPGLAASAMNALAHAVEAFYGPRSDQAATGAAGRAAGLIAGGLRPPANEPAASTRADEPAASPGHDETNAAPGRDELALGSLLAGYALDRAGSGLHHALCQTIVRVSGLAPGAMLGGRVPCASARTLHWAVT